MKTRLKRIVRTKGYFKTALDKCFQKGIAHGFPAQGLDFTFSFPAFGNGYWQTTGVKDVDWKKPGEIWFKTHNSTYVLKRGWR